TVPGPGFAHRIARIRSPPAGQEERSKRLRLPAVAPSVQASTVSLHTDAASAEPCTRRYCAVYCRIVILDVSMVRMPQQVTAISRESKEMYMNMRFLAISGAALCLAA